MPNCLRLILAHGLSNTAVEEGSAMHCHISTCSPRRCGLRPATGSLAATRAPEYTEASAVGVIERNADIGFGQRSPQLELFVVRQ